MAVAIGGCVQGLLYEGNGHFVDRGPTVAIERYLLDLGPVDLSTKNQRQYSMAGLPSVEMVVGFEVVAPSSDGQLLGSRPVDALVEIVLINIGNEPVIRQRERLDRWTWSAASSQESRAFVYQRGHVRERSQGSGVITLERVGVRADGGWGSYFSPRDREMYILMLSVLEPASVSQGYSVRLLVKGGGWKS